MLKIMKRYYKYKKSFYGVNCGTIGFLMNKYQNISLEKKIAKSKPF